MLEHEKTIYYERMMFCIEIPSIKDEIEGNELSLTIGGIKAYNLDNLYNKKGSDEHFKIFIGFKNKVCTNLSLWSDGYTSELKVSNINNLKGAIKVILENYNASHHMHGLRLLSEYSLTENQFAHLIGRCRMYQHLSKNRQAENPDLMFGDNQINALCKDYYKDSNFSKELDGSINLWKLYNLFTGVNKSSNIDNFIDKSVSAFHFTEKLRWALENKRDNWFLS